MRQPVDDWQNILAAGFCEENKLGVGKADFRHEVFGAWSRLEGPAADWVKIGFEEQTENFHRNGESSLVQN